MEGSPRERNEALPRWDLGDLYSGMDAPELGQDLERARGLAKDFGRRFRGRLEALDGAGMGGAIGAYEEIGELLDKVVSYAQLNFAADMSDGERGVLPAGPWGSG